MGDREGWNLSKRKGQAHKTKRKEVKISWEDGETLEALTQSSRMNKGELTGFLYDLCLKYGFHKPGWEERLNKTLDLVDEKGSENEFDFLDDGCHKRAFGKDKTGNKIWSCVAFNESGVVKTRILGQTESLTRGKCRACGLDREVREGIRDRDERIMELEEKINLKAKTRTKVPICQRGAILTEEGSVFKSCPKSSVSVSVSGFCKIVSNGLPCPMFSELWIAEGPR